MEKTDVVVVGAGLAGLVAATELAEAGRRVIVLDQEPRNSLGGQAFWSFGGLFMVDSPEQRRLGVRDSFDLALSDWMAAAAFDREEDYWPRRWAGAFVDFASGEMRRWLHGQGVRWFPFVQWAERGVGSASGPGNTVPRFHVTWGTGPGLIEPFARRVREFEEEGLISLRFCHRATGLSRSGGAISGVTGEVLAESLTERGAPSGREVAGEFEVASQAVIATSGGIGGDHDLVRKNWPASYGDPPKEMLSGVPDYVDGRMLSVVAEAGGNVIGADRMWNYPEGIRNHSPLWTRHGIRILSGPSPLWLDARGERLPNPLFPGFDALGALEHIVKGGHDHSWFVLNRKILGMEFALSGSEQNPDLTNKDVKMLLGRALPAAVAPVVEFARRSPEFISAKTPRELARGMNDLTGERLIDPAKLTSIIEARDRQVASKLGKDAQLQAIRQSRKFLTDRLIRVARPHRLLDPKAGPLIAVRLSILTRKTLGGLETDLSSRVLSADGEPIPGLYAAGEVAGFGGGGMHGHRSLEGTFLGGCLFSGRVAGESAASSIE